MRYSILGILLLCSVSAVLLAQQAPRFPRGETPPEAREDARLRHDREKAMNQKRQEDLKHDTDKLLKLATELKEDVDKTNENVLSLDVIKKADEIEKLAKNVRDKMKAQALEPMPSAEPPR
jgi:hypothetical protein